MSDQLPTLHSTETTVVVALPDVYREVTRLSSNFESFVATYEERERHRARHEDRIQALEKWKAAVPLSAVVAVLSAIAAIVSVTGGTA